MGKILLSIEEVKALESALELSNGDKAHVVQWHAQELFDGVRAPLNKMHLDTVIRALYVGYEVEEKPEDRILEIYHTYLEKQCIRPSWNKAVIEGILVTLNTFNIQIKGINC